MDQFSGFLSTVSSDTNPSIKEVGRGYASDAYIATFTDQPPVLIHGDLTEGNIIIEHGTGKVYFVDWGAADYIQVGDESYVSYMTNLVSSMKPFRDEILQYVAETRGHDVQGFRKRVHDFELLSHPFDVLWAVMMYTKASHGEVKDEPSKFLDIARQRIEDYTRLAEAAL